LEHQDLPLAAVIMLAAAAVEITVRAVQAAPEEVAQAAQLVTVLQEQLVQVAAREVAEPPQLEQEEDQELQLFVIQFLLLRVPQKQQGVQ
jgi:hypothetical protein